MSQLTEPWRSLESLYSVNIENISPIYPELNKSNIFDSDPNFITQAKNRNYYLYPWKIMTLEALELTGRAKLEKAYSVGVDGGKFVFGYVFKFTSDDPFLPIGDVGVIVPENSNDSIISSNIKSNILVPLIANNDKYAVALPLKRGTDLFPQVSLYAGCTGEDFGRFLSPSQDKILSYSKKTATGVGSVIMPPETPDNKNDIRYYAAVKSQWLKLLQEDGRYKSPWKMGKIKCNQNTEMWFNTPANIFRVISATSTYSNNMTNVFGFNIDTSLQVPKDAPPVENSNRRPLPPLKKDYTWVWILIGILVVVALFIFLYFVLK